MFSPQMSNQHISSEWYNQTNTIKGIFELVYVVIANNQTFNTIKRESATKAYFFHNQIVWGWVTFCDTYQTNYLPQITLMIITDSWCCNAFIY